MKTFFNTIMGILEALGKARAASSLARMHKYDEARKVMLWT